MTLALAPAVAISLGILASLSSTAPDTVGEQAADTMLVLHARVFAGVWLLLWALPWWRGLRDVRIAIAAAAGLVLAAGPVRLFDWSNLFGPGGRVFNTYTIIYIVLVGAPLVGFAWAAFARRKWMAASFVTVALFMGLPLYALAAHRAGIQPIPPAPAAPACVPSGALDICPTG